MNRSLKPLAALAVTLTLAFGGLSFGSGAVAYSGGSTGCCKQ